MELNDKQIDLVIYLLENHTFDLIKATTPGPDGATNWFCDECYNVSKTKETIHHHKNCDTPIALELLVSLFEDESEAE